MTSSLTNSSGTPASKGGRGGGQRNHPNPSQITVGEKPPEKPLTPYMRYSRSIWDKVKSSNPDMKVWELGKIVGQMWRDLADADKIKFVEQYEVEKVDYEKKLKAYQERERARIQAQQKNANAQAANVAAINYEPERRFFVEAVDDDPGEDFTNEQLACARFSRNHRLIHQIFSDSIIPDIRLINEEEERKANYDLQRATFEKFQQKVERDLLETQRRHDDRKRKIREGREHFEAEMKRICSKPIVDDATFQAMVERHIENMRKERVLTAPLLQTKMTSAIINSNISTTSNLQLKPPTAN